MNIRARFEPWLWRTWRLVVRAHRFATRVRFSILAAAVFAILLLTPPGQDIVRAVATGPFTTRAADGIEPDFEHLAWFAVGLYLLSLACWGGGRLVLATRFNWQGSDSDIVENEDEREVETRLRRDLPIYFGAMPFVAAGCTFAIAPLREVSAHSPSAQIFAAVAAPLLMFFVLPLWLAMFNLKASVPTGVGAVRSTRNSFGPLSFVLAGYSGLAAWHAFAHQQDLGALGGIPIVLFVTALWVFGLDRRSFLFTVPVALVVGAAWTWRWEWARWQPGLILPLLVLLALAALGFLLPGSASAGSKAAPGRPRADDTFIPVHLPALTLLRLLWDPAAMEPGLALAAQYGSPASTLAETRQNGPVLRRFLWLAVCLLLLHILLLLAVLWSPQAIPTAVGSGCMLALGLCAIATIGNALLFATQASRFPILTAFVVLALLSSGLMDNHAIRLEPGDPTPALPERAGFRTDPVAESFEQWRGLNTSGRPATEAPPCLIIATEGGGIRAAFWTATVLSRLQELSRAPMARTQRADFASHVFAISGVSGGSVGAAVFAALCADHRDEPGLTRKAAALAGRDHLAPTLAGLFYPDLLQRFLPAACLPDRAHFFEGSWEAAWPQESGTAPPRNRLREGFLRLWEGRRASDPWLPNLFLNSTAVEDGRRLIAGSLPVWTGPGGQFVDAHDFHEHLRADGTWRDLPLISAAHASARFPLVSPPGRLPSGLRAVDGGYFENSGATTALDILRRVQRVQHQSPRPQSPIIFLFLRFGTEPALTDLPAPAATGPARSTAANPNYPRRNWLNETASIVSTVLSTRDARGSYAADGVFNRYAFEAVGIHVLSFTFSGESIPLSWSLSRRSCEAMLEQLPTAAHLTAPDPEVRDPRGAPASPTLRANVAVAQQLMKLLYSAP